MLESARRNPAQAIPRLVADESTGQLSQRTLDADI